MAKTSRTRADVLEREYEAGVTVLIRGVGLLVASLVLMWLFHTSGLVPLAALALVGVLAGGVVCVFGGLRISRARSRPATVLECPYCQHPMQFLEPPTADFTCEGCNRLVIVQDGALAPVRDISCPVCKTVHKVAEKAATYTCDRCNRVLRLADAKDPQKIVADDSSDIFRNYDVILTQAGRQPNEVAMALQSVLVCNLRDARAQMENLPLTVMRNVPERKADALRTRLRELGATAVIRPTSDDPSRTGR